ncbi:hypothetical protein NP590_13650 [Methylomonas sp. SURF-2]|uniref:Uncharacterized protein n=1 Tax=Methylomonas subterranea TaxID=2952225 RepID=A0ABT1TI65_9GAMM|nr:hypothetical protein [Methylomonas sp. SURF-2]MCQ8105155.1 hypothetical protein [Methylomonas sp. SURF-2]
MYKYENDSVLMCLAIESYFTSWVNYHFKIWNQYPEFKSEILYFTAVRKLAKDIVTGIDEISQNNNDFFSNLILSKIDLLDKIIETGVKDSENYNALLMEYEKDRALFKREIIRLKGEL